MLKAVMLKVFELAGSETDHIPPVMVSSILLFMQNDVEERKTRFTLQSIIPCPLKYDFEINNARRADDRDEVYSRVANLPALINLGS